ncbi:MAG: hypothetical protein ABIS50_11775 [Luteolibacter sp.]|uniref:hypothetical protein n=1 Tax=Luteolibacter sp. TaxID=1962973 RepID=UPI0032672964
MKMTVEVPEKDLRDISSPLVSTTLKRGSVICRVAIVLNPVIYICLLRFAVSHSGRHSGLHLLGLVQCLLQLAVPCVLLVMTQKRMPTAAHALVFGDFCLALLSWAAATWMTFLLILSTAGC